MLLNIAQFFKKIFLSPRLKKKILVTAGALLVFRIAAHIPAAGIDRESLSALFMGSPLLSLLDLYQRSKCAIYEKRGCAYNLCATSENTNI